MSLNLRSIAMRGVGFGPMAMATLGLQDVLAPQQEVLGVGGGVWPFVYPKAVHPRTAEISKHISPRARRAREAVLLWMRHP